MEVAIWQLVLALLAGVATGVFYFGGLWLTVRRVPTSRQPHLLVFASFIGRVVVIVFVMVLIARVHWQLLVACMVTFVLTRVVLTRRLGPSGPDDSSKTEAE